MAIAASVAPAPIAIGFARNQDDPRRASLTTLLPAADQCLHADWIRPAATSSPSFPAQAGRGVPAMRSFAEFAALPTASGLVITPYADDLDVSVNATPRHHLRARRAWR